MVKEKVPPCLYCGGRITFVGVYQNQFRYVCVKCKRLQRSLEKLDVPSELAQFDISDLEVVEEDVVEEEPELD